MSHVAPHLALMLTRRCNMACGHCSVASGPQVKGEPEAAELLDYLRQAAAAGVRSIQLTGGEPMLRAALVLRLLRECKRLGLASAMTTNGFWGQTLADARRHMQALRRAGLVVLTVSYDRYHAEFLDPQPLLNIAQVADETNFSVNINIVRVGQDPELQPIVDKFAGFQHIRLRFYDVQPVGRARMFPAASLRSEVEGFCNACAAPALTDDGRLTACNGPSYFVRPDSPLQLGSLRQTSLQSLLERHWSDPILEAIRTSGPSRLREELQHIPEFETFPFRERYQGMCDLCHHITSNPDAVRALRTRLDRPAPRAERQAAWQVIQGSRRDGGLNREYVNGIGACRIFLTAILADEGRWPRESARVLGRADVDWSQLAEYLAGSGMARPLLPALKDSELTRWAPSFFVERLRARAIQDGLCGLVQREAIRRIASTLRDLGGRGILLKGAAVLVLEEGAEDSWPMRATGDIDVYVEPPLAPLLRRKLIDSGFAGAVEAARSAPHHLAPVSFQGIPVEIHTRVMPAFWGLPEQELLARARRVDGMDALCTLDPEGFLLHAGMHVTAHLFSYGLKTAWDLYWTLRRFPELDWARLARWIGMSRLPRGFWVPVRVLCQEMEIPLPQELLSRAPVDQRQWHLETIARHRLFAAREGPFDLNPFSKTAVFLLLHDSWLGAARYLIMLGGREASEARHSARRNLASPAVAQLTQQLREARFHWQQYRRALARSTASRRT